MGEVYECTECGEWYNQYQKQQRAKIGGIMEDNPDLPYEFVRQSIIAEAEREAGKLESYVLHLDATDQHVCIYCAEDLGLFEEG